MSYEISGYTKLIALLGSPVSHSLSPAMHNEAFKQLNLDYSYMAFDVKKEELEKIVTAFRIMDVKGMNITMPCKNRMAELCDTLSPAARLCGAVNTVVNDHGKLMGYTTDGLGFMRSAKEHGFMVKNSKIVLLGTGGAGTSILVQAALDGASKICVFCRKSSTFYERTVQAVRELNKEVSCEVTIHEYSELAEELKDAALLVNTTKVGMNPNIDSCLIPDSSYFHKGLIVGDVIYNPLETKLVKMAKSAKLQAFGGKDMLLYQGAECFKIWTGMDMPVEIIREKYF